MRKRSVFLVAVVVVIVAALGIVVGRNVGNRSAPTTTTNIASGTHGRQPRLAIWPFATSSTRFGDPVLAVETFAIAYLGMDRPFIGKFQRLTNHSGIVPVRASSQGVTTTVYVGEINPSHTWWVSGAVSPNIEVTNPLPSEVISSPVRLRGRSTAYEAVVNVQVRQDGTLTPLATRVVMGGSMGVMGPFTASISMSAPSATSGAVVFRTYSPKDGRVEEATVIRVRYHS